MKGKKRVKSIPVVHWSIRTMPVNLRDRLNVCAFGRNVSACDMAIAALEIGIEVIEEELQREYVEPKRLLRVRGVIVNEV